MTRITSACILSLLSQLCLAGTPDPKAVIEPTPEKSIYAFDFQERLRFEIRENNFDFNDEINTVNDDSWLLQRARLGLKVSPTDYLSFYVQGQSSFELGSERPNEPGVLGAEGDDAIDLRQAYIQTGPEAFNITMGRQLLTYGDERLVGGFDWNNIGRTFDAVKLHYHTDLWSLDVFSSSVVVPDSDEFNYSDFLDGNDTGRDQIFSGLYFSTKLIPVQRTDLYAFHLHESYTAGDTNFVTLGTRIKADVLKTSGFDYETEIAVQFGDVKGQNLSAFAGHWGAGYVWIKSPIKPRLFFEYNFASGDDSSADSDVGTFQNLFPTNHKFYGYMDVFSWQNIHNPAVSFSIQPAKGVKLQLDYHAFWLAKTTDVWYRANGVTAVRPMTKGADSFVGTELDFTVSWKVTKQLSFLAGYSHFFAGNYLKASGRSDDADFAYVQATFDF